MFYSFLRVLRTSHCCVPLAMAFALLGGQSAFAISLNPFWPVTGIGVAVDETRKLEGFQGVSAHTGARVVLRLGDHDGVDVHADDNVAPLIDIHMEDGTLVIRDDKSYTSSSVQVTVTARRIKAIACGGSTAVTATSASIGQLTAALGGSSVLVLDGTARKLTGELGGSSSLNAAGLEAGSVAVSGGGSSHATVWARRALSVSVGGSADLGYYGKVHPSVATAGSATVRNLGPAPNRGP